jgi:hypothetical protein
MMISKPSETMKKGIRIALEEGGDSGNKALKPGANFFTPPVLVARSPGYSTLLADTQVPSANIPLHCVPCHTLHDPWFSRLIGFNAVAFKAAIKLAASDSSPIDSVYIFPEPDHDKVGFSHNNPVSTLAWMMYTFHPWWVEATTYWLSIHATVATKLAGVGYTSPTPFFDSKEDKKMMFVIKDVMDALVDSMERRISKQKILSNMSNFGLNISLGPLSITKQDERLIKANNEMYDEPMTLDVVVQFSYILLTSDFPTLPVPIYAYPWSQSRINKPRRLSDDEEEEKERKYIPPPEVLRGQRKRISKDKYTVVSSSAGIPSTTESSPSSSSSSSSKRMVTLGQAHLPYVDPADM